jgi:hypothetical protein
VWKYVLPVGAGPRVLHSGAAATTSNCVAISSEAYRGSEDGGGAAGVSSRADRPTGTSGTPIPASRSAKSSSGGAHVRAAVPQPHGERHQWFDVPASPVRRQQKPQLHYPVSADPGFGG